MIHVRAAAVKNIRSAACIDLSGVRFCNAIEDMRAFLRRHSEFLFHCTKTPHSGPLENLPDREKTIRSRPWADYAVQEISHYVLIDVTWIYLHIIHL